MMKNKPIQLVTAFKAGTPMFPIEVGEPVLSIAEFFLDTIQGENNVGFPAAFLRFQGCTLRCNYCDTAEVWHYGREYGFKEIFMLMQKVDTSQRSLIDKLKDGQHLVITGGSPLKQQKNLVLFLKEFARKFGFMPYIEIENECTIYPDEYLISVVSCWNNSPKLVASGNRQVSRYFPAILLQLSQLGNSWFKFVISKESEWNEIERDFLEPGLIEKRQVVLMPLGATKEELELNREGVLEIAIEHNVRYTTREHIVLWDRATGV